MAQKIYVLADSSKINTYDLNEFGSLSQIDGLITDSGIDEEGNASHEAPSGQCDGGRIKEKKSCGASFLSLNKTNIYACKNEHKNIFGNAGNIMNMDKIEKHERKIEQKIG